MIGYEGMTPAEESEAKDALDALTVAYPGHPWFVSVRGGCLRIRWLSFEAPYGMNIRFSEVNHDAAVLKKKVIYYAGEWLERAGLMRGKRLNDDPVVVEGVPDKYQPALRKSIDEIGMEVVIAKDNALRENPLPQVAELQEKLKEENGQQKSP